VTSAALVTDYSSVLEGTLPKYAWYFSQAIFAKKFPLCNIPNTTQAQKHSW